MIWILFIACAEPITEVQMTGQVLSALDSSIGAPEVQVIIRDGETEDYSETTTDEDGIFTVAVPVSSAIHMEFSGPSHVPTAFSALTDAQDFTVPIGDMWLRSAAEVDALRASFAGCPSVDLEGGIVEGEVHYNAVSTASETHLIAEEASVTIYEADGTTHTVCYLDGDGLSDPDAEVVGGTGRFAAFGVPGGPITVGFQTQTGVTDNESFGFVLLPEDGIAPFYPALIAFQ
jgi:hypothetical protein